MADIAYYPGCSLHSLSKEYDKSFTSVCNELGIGLKEIKGWICCGSTPVASTNHVLSLSLSFKNISFAEKMGLKEIVAPCASCYLHLRNALYESKNHSPLLKELEDICETTIDPEMNVLHPLELYSRVINPAPEKSRFGIKAPDIRSKIVKDLSGLKIACYYGCQIVRPPKVMDFDYTELPESMDLLIEAFGAQTVNWEFKTDCCGASLAMARPDIIVELSGKILNGALEAGADFISVACPMCQFNLDSRQEESKEKHKLSQTIPIVYITQLMGYALGLTEKDLGFKRHFIDPRPVLSNKTQVS